MCVHGGWGCIVTEAVYRRVQECTRPPPAQALLSPLRTALPSAAALPSLLVAITGSDARMGATLDPGVSHEDGEGNSVCATLPGSISGEYTKAEEDNGGSLLANDCRFKGLC